MLYQKIKAMYKGTREQSLSNVVKVDDISKVGDISIIVPVKTDKGFKKSIGREGQIQGEYKDYTLNNLLDLGVKLNETHINTYDNETLKNKVEFYAKQFLINNKIIENE